MDELRRKVCMVASLAAAVAGMVNRPDAGRRIERIQCLANLAERETEELLRELDETISAGETKTRAA